MHHRTLLVLGAAGLAAAAATTSAMMLGQRTPAPGATGMVYLRFQFASGRTLEHGECSGTLLTPSWVLTARHCTVPVAWWFGHRGVRVSENGDSWRAGAARAATWEPTGQQFVIAGSAPDAAGVTRPALWRYEPSVTALALTPAFGDDGNGSITRLAGSGDGALTAIERTRGGDLIAAGWATVGGADQQLVMRFDRDGHLQQTSVPALDRPLAASFGPTRPGRARALAVFPDGGVVVVGSRTDAAGVSRWTAARYDAAGNPTAAYDYLDGAGITGALTDVAVVGCEQSGCTVVALGTRATGPTGSQPVLVVLGNDAAGPIAPIAGWDPATTEPRALAADGNRVVVAGERRDRTRILASRHLVPSLALDGQFAAGGLAVRAIEDDALTVASAGVAVDVAHRVLIGVALGYDNGAGTINLARFTADGRPDPAFGQTGQIAWMGREGLVGTELALAPEGIVAGVDAPWSGVAVVVGSRQSVAAPAAVAFSTVHHDQVPSDFRAVLGTNPSVAIAKVVAFPDSTVDAALIKLATPLPGPIRYAGVADAEALRWNQRLICYGFGEHEVRADDPDRTEADALRRGVFAFDNLHPTTMNIASVCDSNQCSSFLAGGDSGGACFIDEGPGQSWHLAAVINTGDGTPARDRWSVYPNSPTQTGARADRLATWIAATLAAP